MKIDLKTATLEMLDLKCYSVKGTKHGHNIIGIICREAEERFGEQAAENLYNKYQAPEPCVEEVEVDCEECYGTGWWQPYLEEGNDLEEDCPTCDGEGVVKIEKY